MDNNCEQIVIEQDSGLPGSVDSFSAGTTGLTPSVPTTGDIVLDGVLVGANGGTGVANTGKTMTLGGNVVFSGSFNPTFAIPASVTYTFPGIASTLATLGANTFTGTQLIPDGSATNPSLGIASAPGMGLRRYTAYDGSGFPGMGFTLGYAAGTGKQAMNLVYRSYDFGGGNQYDNVLMVLGTGQTIRATGHDTYVATIAGDSTTVTGGSDSAPVMLNIGSYHVTVAHALSPFTRQFCVIEADKMDISVDSGTATINDAVQTRFRWAWPDTGVTVTRNKGIDFVLPEGNGVSRDIIGINFPAMTGAHATNWYGLLFNNTPNGGSMSSADGVDLYLRAGTGSSQSHVIVEGSGASGQFQAMTQGAKVFVAGPSGGGSWILVNASGAVPVFVPDGASTNINIGLFAKGTGGVSLGSNNGTLQVRVEDTASANRYLRLTGSNGGNPTIGASAGAVGFISELVTLASATGTAGFNIPHGAAPTSPVDGDMWTTTAGAFIRINGVTKTFTLI